MSWAYMYLYFMSAGLEHVKFTVIIICIELYKYKLILARLDEVEKYTKILKVCSGNKITLLYKSECMLPVNGSSHSSYSFQFLIFAFNILFISFTARRECISMLCCMLHITSKVKLGIYAANIIIHIPITYIINYIVLYISMKEQFTQ